MAPKNWETESRRPRQSQAAHPDRKDHLVRILIDINTEKQRTIGRLEFVLTRYATRRSKVMSKAQPPTPRRRRPEPRSVSSCHPVIPHRQVSTSSCCRKCAEKTTRRFCFNGYLALTTGGAGTERRNRVRCSRIGTNDVQESR